MLRSIDSRVYHTLQLHCISAPLFWWVRPILATGHGPARSVLAPKVRCTPRFRSIAKLQNFRYTDLYGIPNL
jgi:hypothetical protein